MGMISRDQRIPNFLYIGPDKAGSTWIYEVLKRHPEVFMSPAKELFYFDYFYQNRWNWYLRHFKGADLEHRIIGEVSHDYLFSVEACLRIARDLPNVRLMVCLREPIDRAFSAYLYMIRQGRVNGSFEATLESMTELIDHGLYAKHLAPYIETFGLENIHIGIFDDLKENPSIFAKDLFRFLGIGLIELPQDVHGEVLPASRPRSMVLAKVAKQTAVAIRQWGTPTVVSWIKSSSLVGRALYRPYSQENKPKMSEEIRQRLKDVFYPDILRLDEVLKLGLRDRWGYGRL